MFDSQTTTLIRVFLTRYQRWCRQQESTPVISVEPGGIPCFRSYEVDKINQCNNPVIAIDTLKEGLHELEYFNQYRPDRHYLIFSGAWWNPDNHDLSIPYTLIYSNFLLYEIVSHYLNPNSDFFYQYQNYNFDYPKKFSFVAVHGRQRKHRLKFKKFLLQQIAHKNFIFKLEGEDYGQDSAGIDLIQKKPNTSLQDLFAEKFGHYDQAHKAQWLCYAHKIYDQGYFQVVLETDFYSQDQFFLTEKTIRPLMSGQPFVVAATPGFLAHLRNLGFRTYDSLWNETYDSIINHWDRTQALINLCINLEKFDWSKHKQQLIDIANHNRSQFFNLSQRANLEFVNFENTVKTLI